MILDINKYVEATYEWSSMAGTYLVPCRIHGWDDKSERFAISYYDSIMEETSTSWVPYEYVTGWTWQSLSEKFAAV